MSAQSQSQSVSPGAEPFCRKRFAIILGSFAVLLAITAALLFCGRGPDPTFEWLPPGAMGPGAVLGKLAQLKNSIKNITAPVWRPFSRKPRVITISSSLMRIAPDGVALAGFGPPISTNANGARVWVVDRNTLLVFVPPLDAIRDNHAVTMFEGGRASISSSGFIIVGGTNDLKTFQLSYAPKIVSEGIRLDVAVTLNSPKPGGTDLASIRARIPTAGALLLDCPTATANGGRHYLLLFKPGIFLPATTPTTGAYTTTPPHSFP